MKVIAFTLLICLITVQSNRLLQATSTQLTCATVRCSKCHKCVERRRGPKCRRLRGCCLDGSECTGGDVCRDNECVSEPCIITMEYNPYCCGTTTYSNPGAAACDKIDVTAADSGCVQGACCGTILGLTCPPGENCVDVPNDGCDPTKGGADCLGTCQVPIITCANMLCQQCSTCIDSPDGPSCVAVDGCCTSGDIACSGKGEICLDDADDSCDPFNGGQYCFGTCQVQCGGIAGLQCSNGQKCVDIPNDGCDPDNGGADCSGTCQPCITTREYNPYCCGGTTYSNPSVGTCAGIDVTSKDSGCLQGSCCGTILGLTCPDGQTCVDAPNDSCDPNNGGNDCLGTCQIATP